MSNTDNRTASLKEAIVENSITAVTKLLRVGGASDYIHAKDNRGYTALMYSQSSEITSLLLKAGANVNAKDIWGFTALMFSKSSEKTSQLLAAGADVNVRADNGYTALMLSETNETTALLLSAGANINTKNNHGDTPLIYAIKAGNEEQVRCLLAHGADTTIKNEQDKTALDAALYKHDLSLATLILAADGNSGNTSQYSAAPQWIKLSPQKNKERAALLQAAGISSRTLNLSTELKPTPQDLADAGERLRNARAELAAECSRVSLRAIRGRAVQVCIALQGLELPALITLHILEELDEKARSVRMGALWALIVAVKHSRPEA